MAYRNRISGTTGIFVALLATGCATGPTQEAVQMGDSQMTCTELKAEIERLGGTRKQAHDGATAAGATMLAAPIALAFVPFVGPIISGAAIVKGGNDLETANAAQRRYEYLAQVYNNKGCGAQEGASTAVD